MGLKINNQAVPKLKIHQNNDTNEVEQVVFNSTPIWQYYPDNIELILFTALDGSIDWRLYNPNNTEVNVDWAAMDASYGDTWATDVVVVPSNGYVSIDDGTQFKDSTATFDRNKNDFYMQFRVSNCTESFGVGTKRLTYNSADITEEVEEESTSSS